MEGGREVSEILNLESSAFTDVMHLDMASGLPEKRESRSLKDFDRLKATNNRVSRQ